MTLRVIIADDEPLARCYLATILTERDDVEIVTECENGRQTIDAVLAYRPDVLFLDIQMPGMTGFDVIDNIQSDLLPKIVFTTAYAEFAVEAFKVGAVNYVLKPLEDAQVFESLDRAKTLMTSKSTLLNSLVPVAPQDSTPPKKTSLIVKDRDVFAKLNIEDIIWVEAAGDYICIHLAEGTRLIRSTLKTISKRLSEENFMQVHRSTLVNLNAISETDVGPKGELVLRLSSGSELYASRRYSRAVKARLDEEAL